MTEEFLQYVWKHALAGKSGLRTSDDKPIEIIRIGIHNRDAGPDFFNAQLVIDGVHWAGNVEVHVRSSAWGQHKHHLDDAYKNVILHVVWEDDDPVFRADKTPIPAIEIKKYIANDIVERYNYLRFSSKTIPCEADIMNMDSLIISSWMERLVAERLERKSDFIALKLNNYINDWEEVFYHILLANIGNPVNTAPFETLATIVPFKLLAKQGRNRMETEALLFGQAGLLNGEYDEEYPKMLQKEYNYLRHKLNLTPMTKSEWKFMRIRPFNFPTLRIAQIAAIVNEHAPLFRKMVEAEGVEDIARFLSSEPSAYWQTHYRFGSPKRAKKDTPTVSAVESSDRNDKDQATRPQGNGGAMGLSTINMLIINAVVPILFMYGIRTFNDELCQKALNILHKLKPEKNSLLSDWKKVGIVPADAHDSQALIELRRYYCNERRCIHCAVGHQIMKKK